MVFGDYWLEFHQNNPINKPTYLNTIIMTTIRYQYQTTPQNSRFAEKKIPIVSLDNTDNAGHGDHWHILTDDYEQIPTWLSQSLEEATVPQGLISSKTCDDYLVIASNNSCHVKQVFGLDNGKPAKLINAFPAVNSPYGLSCHIHEIIACDDSQDAILHLKTPDGTSIYAFDTLYAINHCQYEGNKSYYINLSAWAYTLTKSQSDEVIMVDDPKAIRYHRAFNDIVSENNGQIPDDINERIAQWIAPDDMPLDPVAINLGHSCIYLFGETFGQEDEAWCQGQVLGKSQTHFFGQVISLFDVVILREPDTKPFVVRIATPSSPNTEAIEVHDYIQANIWLQAAVYAGTQTA